MCVFFLRCVFVFAVVFVCALMFVYIIAFMLACGFVCVRIVCVQLYLRRDYVHAYVCMHTHVYVVSCS